MKGHKPHSLEYMPVVANKTVIHYTCNAPSKEILQTIGIESIGHKFGCVDSREVLKIPFEIYKKQGFQIPQDKYQLIINSELLMKRLS
ncbi:MAG: hypothetical protein KJ646_00495 [Nanoarchaeota archaeon]|nr:hypothetical protein [Nanoarchaeota archaeon]MBU4116360.1 hypothetical protein [Nanoarchaeota archaeon]